jgi:dephospho-CoA kinase
VLAPRDALLARVAARGMSELGVAARLAAQASEDEFRQAADVIIQNDGDRDALRAAVAAAWSTVRVKG